MCFRFVHSFLVTLKQKKKTLNTQAPAGSSTPRVMLWRWEAKGESPRSFVVNVNGALWHCWKEELLIGEVIGAGLCTHRREAEWDRWWVAMFFVVLKINADVLMLDMWLVGERCGSLWLDKEERAGSERQEQVVIQRPCWESDRALV